MTASTKRSTKNSDAKGFIAIEGTAQTNIDAIRLCGAALEAKGYVTDAFAQGCIDREEHFPTGICKSDAIVTSALCYLRLTEPVEFHRMDDDEQTVNARHIFNLAIAPGDHLEFLSKTMQLLADPSVLEAFENMTIDEVAGYLEEHLS